MTYTYDPAEIRKRSISRARFELGDILVDGGAEMCMLSDEEIKAVIDDTPKWKKALFLLADAVCMRLSYETDWRDDGTSFNLAQRAERWQKLRDRFEREAKQADTVPACSAVEDAIRNPEDKGHYFYGGMMESPYVQPPMPGGEKS